MAAEPSRTFRRKVPAFRIFRQPLRGSAPPAAVLGRKAKRNGKPRFFLAPGIEPAKAGGVKTTSFVAWAWLLLAGSAFSSSAATQEWLCGCQKHLLFPDPVGNKSGRKYARDRKVDLRHLKLEVTPDFKTRSLAATATLDFAPIGLPLATLELDAVGLRIATVETTGAALAEYQTTDEKLILTFREPLAPGTAASAAITYTVTPENGLYFRTPEMGYPAGDTQLWTQGEPELHRFWFPGYDYPNERFTSEVICHAPEGMEVISNGTLVRRAPGANGLVTTHWRQEQPHVNYLVALACGYFHKIEDSLDGLPLAVFVPPSGKAEAANTFLDTKKIIAFFQREIGVPFPWAKYYQVFCHDFLAGGMENTSCTFNAERLMFPDATEQLRTLHRLDAHETAHQWFGDLVTCRDWSHLWLNEGFASYYTLLYEREKFGADGFAHGLWREAQRVLSSNDTKPIVWRDYTDPQLQFDYRAYPKGAWVLHMLRSQLGEALYRTAIKTYLERHRDGIVTTDDLQQALEDVSGLSFDQFFDQWVYHGGFPELGVEYAWDAAAKLARLTVRQKQKVSAEVPLFRFPLPVRFTLPGGAVKNSVLQVSADTEDFYIALEAAPEMLRIDPDFTVLAKVDFQPPGELADRQLTQGDMLGRFYAVQALAEKKDEKSLQKLVRAASEDAFWGVRAEAIKSIRQHGTSEARTALLSLPPQADARVRQEWIAALGSSFTPESRDVLLKLRAEEKNPELRGSIIAALPPSPQWNPADDLGQDSYRQIVAFAAIKALRAQDRQDTAPAILARLQAFRNPPADRPAVDTGDYAAALDALAFLSREQADPAATLDFLAGHLTHPRVEYRTAAAKALGTLNHPRAVALLTPLSTGRKLWKDPVRDAANASLAAIAARRTGAPEVQNLVQRLQDQQKRIDELQEKLEKLEQKNAPQK